MHIAVSNVVRHILQDDYCVPNFNNGKFVPPPPPAVKTDPPPPPPEVVRNSLLYNDKATSSSYKVTDWSEGDSPAGVSNDCNFPNNFKSNLDASADLYERGFKRGHHVGFEQGKAETRALLEGRHAREKLEFITDITTLKTIVATVRAEAQLAKELVARLEQQLADYQTGIAKTLSKREERAKLFKGKGKPKK